MLGPGRDAKQVHENTYECDPIKRETRDGIPYVTVQCPECHRTKEYIVLPKKPFMGNQFDVYRCNGIVILNYLQQHPIVRPPKPLKTPL